MLINTTSIISKLRSIVGDDKLIIDEANKISYETDWRKRFYAKCLAVIFPINSEMIIKIIELANYYNLKIIIQGGNTSLCGAAIPDKNLSYTQQIIINLSKMNKIIELDLENLAISVEAGCTLQQINDYLNSYNLTFPLAIASKNQCQIGGNIATNAGGVNVIKYGNTRNLVLGLEVILANGQIINQLNVLKKNNINFDLKQLFIGSEGTLGVITKATLSLYHKAKTYYTVLLGVENITVAINLFNKLRSYYTLNAFEIIDNNTQNLYDNIFYENKLPIRDAWLILFEIEIFLDNTNSGSSNYDAIYNETILKIFQNLEINLDKVIIAETNKKRDYLWNIRENIPLAEHTTGIAIKHDIALPINYIAEFIKINTNNIQKTLETFFAKNNINLKYSMIIFGHLGDGNLHYNVQFSLKNKIDIPNFEKLEIQINKIVYDDIATYNGTFSAEHGVGQLKKAQYRQYHDTNSYNLAKLLKNTLDPNKIFNSAVLFD